MDRNSAIARSYSALLISCLTAFLFCCTTNIALCQPEKVSQVSRLPVDSIYGLAGGVVVDRYTGLPVKEVTVVMTDESGRITKEESTNGRFSFGITNGHLYILSARKPGRFSTRATIETSDPTEVPMGKIRLTLYLDTAAMYGDFFYSPQINDPVYTLQVIQKLFKNNAPLLERHGWTLNKYQIWETILRETHLPVSFLRKFFLMGMRNLYALEPLAL
jgi:hypothetical protein